MLLVDKPAGITSHDVVAITRKAIGERRLGHTGTLDPFATGLLVLLAGRATRLLPYVEDEPKVYLADIAFGAETDTDDVDGAVVRTAPPPDRAAIDHAILRFTGRIDQVPPAYSAKRVAGQRAYAAARSGEPLELRPVPVTVLLWKIVGWSSDVLRVRITCTGGTYIRALARDLGRALESAAHLRALRRERSGVFEVLDAQPLSEIADGRARVRPPLHALPTLPVERLGADEVRRISNGVRIPARVDGERAALVMDDGALLAIAEREGGEWQPRVVLSDG